jgi:hypothetical protein
MMTVMSPVLPTFAMWISAFTRSIVQVISSEHFPESKKKPLS